MRSRTRIALAVPALAGLVAGGVATAAVATPHAAQAPHAHHFATTATFKAVIKNKKLTLSGPTTVHAGLVNASLHSVDREYELGVLSFKSGYSIKQFKADLKAFETSYGKNGPSKAGLRHYRHLINHTFGYGGFDVTAKKTESGTMLFNRPGAVYIFNDSGNLPSQVHKITVVGHTSRTSVPATHAVVRAQENRRFGGSSTLPAAGTITVKNTATTLPHFLALQHVKTGATRKQIIQALQNNDPSLFRNGSAGTDVLTAGRSMRLTYKLPKGTYAEMCFMPDPKTGMPHALMGMVRIVKVG